MPKLAKVGKDIVHALWKHRDKCKERVVGSNPTWRANFPENNISVLFYTRN